MSGIETDRLYLVDAQLNSCTAEVKEVVVLEETDARIKYGTHALILNQTVFHPQGGGQPSDQGSISCGGAMFVVKFVQVGSNGIEHMGTMASSVAAPELPEPMFHSGSVVECLIDEDLRSIHTILHSAGHAIDAALKRLGYFDRIQAGKGYHFTDGPYVEYVGSLTETELNSLPDDINDELSKIISENIPTRVTMMDKERAGEICQMDTSAYPDILRVVEVAGCACPCGGTHTSNSRDLAGVKVMKVKKKKKNIRVSYSIKYSASCHKS